MDINRMPKDTKINEYFIKNLCPLLKQFNSKIRLVIEVYDNAYSINFWINVDGERINFDGLIDFDYIDRYLANKIERVLRNSIEIIRNNKYYKSGCMNYYNSTLDENFKESTILNGIEADSFLEFTNIRIDMNNNTISIGGFTIDGYLGQSILAENGIILNEDHIAINNKYILNEFRSHGHFNPERLEDRIDNVEGNKNKSSNNERLYKNPPSADELNKRFKSIFNQSENNSSKKSGKKITLDDGTVVTLPENSIIINGNHIALEGSTIFKYANLITK